MKNMPSVYGRDLDLNLLRVFAVVAEEGSVTVAAQKLYVTQPAVSAAIKRLSAFVGAELFTRQGHGLVLTNRGARLLAAAQAHLLPLVTAAIAPLVFEPQSSTASVRLGLSDGMEPLLPIILRLLRDEAPNMQLVVVPVQFRTVEAQLLSENVDLAVSIADDLPRSIVRQPLHFGSDSPAGFACLYDPRFVTLSDPVSEAEYFEQEHVIVSYAGDARGIIEDTLGKSRKVRVSVGTFSYVAEVVDGSALVATVPLALGRHITKTRPHLRCVVAPFVVTDVVGLDLLWLRSTSDDDVVRFARDLVTRAAASIRFEPKPSERRT